MLDVLGDHVNARSNPAPIGLEFRFAGPSGPDTAAKARQRHASAHEPGQQVFQLRELDLQLPFPRPRAPGEDVEDELRAIDDLATDLLFDLPELRRGQLAVENDDAGIGLRTRGGQRRDLSLPEKRRGVRLGTLLQHAQHDLGAGRFGQPAELVERSFRVEPAGPARDQPDERRALRSFYARLTHACTSSHARAPARTSRGADPVTSTMVDG